MSEGKHIVVIILIAGIRTVKPEPNALRFCPSDTFCLGVTVGLSVFCSDFDEAILVQVGENRFPVESRLLDHPVKHAPERRRFRPGRHSGQS